MMWPCFLRTVAVWRRGDEEFRLRSDGRWVYRRDSDGDIDTIRDRRGNPVKASAEIGEVCLRREGFVKVR